jgi:hypothetical protein
MDSTQKALSISKSITEQWREAYNISEKEKTFYMMQNDRLTDLKLALDMRMDSRRQWRKFRKTYVRSIAAGTYD